MIPICPKTTPKPARKKQRWLSPSSINQYLRCPRSFYYSKIEKRKQKPSIHLIRGIAVHNAIRQFYQHGFHRCGGMEYSDLRKTVNELLKDEFLNQEKGLLELKLNRDEMEFYVRDSQNMMINFLQDFIKAGGFEAESPVLEKTLFSKKYMLLGRIDAIHRDKDPPLLIDYKTCKSKELTEDYKRQLGIYALLYKERFHTLPGVGIQFLKFPDGLETYRLDDSYIDSIKDLVLDIHAKTQSENIENYPCTCGWCHKNYAID